VAAAAVKQQQVDGDHEDDDDEETGPHPLGTNGFDHCSSLQLYLRRLQRRRPACKQKDLCRAAKVSLELAFPAVPGLGGP
jgi:hypothetical protein